MRFLYCIYQLLIAAPLILLSTLILTTATIVGCTLFDGKWWGYYPPVLWSKLMVWLVLLPVKVEGREKLTPGTTYAFVANHQGPYDIFLIYGFLGYPFRWMMKRELLSIPLIGTTCKKSGHIMVDKRGPKAIKRTQDQARETLKEGISMVIFPEGSRSFTGHMAHFRRGAFQLAHQLELPVVPMTIDGSFDVLPRQKGIGFVNWHRLRLVIHDPIPYNPDMDSIIEESYSKIMSALPVKYQGFEENPDQ